MKPKFDKYFHYYEIKGKLNFLEKEIRLDVTHTTHQIAQFCEDPRVLDSLAIKHVVRYSRSTKDKELLLKLDDNLLEVYVDSNFYR